MFQIQEWHFLSQDSEADILIGLSCQRVVPYKRFALVGGNNHIFIVRHNTNKRNGENVNHVIRRHHISSSHHIKAHTVDDQVDF